MAADGEQRGNDFASAQAGLPGIGSSRKMSSASSERPEDEEDEETEPRLKYTKLTSQLVSVYRKDDSASAFLTSGDKVIIGTHSGNVHVLSLPSLRTIKLYRAHSASITSISVSPHVPLLSGLSGESAEDARERPSAPSRRTTSFQQPTASPNSPKDSVPATAANTIHIATSSIDGHVCVSSLVDPKHVTLRNFARPVQTVALSPEYKYDRAYISGGPAGNLVLTTGARPGVSSDANTNSAAAAASGWLGQIGLSSNTGRDIILHSGEGSISAVAWSFSGKYVAWVNEHGIKILRSSSFLDPADAASAWTRIGHIDAPNRRVWQEMVGVWKAKAHWINHRYLEDTEIAGGTNGNSRQSSGPSNAGTPTRASGNEHLLVGWGDAIWVIDVNPKPASSGKTGAAKSFGKVTIVHHFKIDDGIVSGLTLYTPKLLLALIYRTHDGGSVPVAPTADTASPRGIKRRQNGMPPEMRLISLDSASKEELDLEGLVVARYQSLSAADYHLSTSFFATPPRLTSKQRGTLGMFGDGLWDVSVGATSRLISSSASVLSGSSGDDKTSGSGIQVGAARSRQHIGNIGIPPPFVQPGLKVLVMSPFDCLLGVKRDTSDHLNWLVETGQFQHAWELLEKHPEILQSEPLPESRPETPTKTRASLADFFADDDSSSSDTRTIQKEQSVELKREKRRIGDMWIQQLVQKQDWSAAGAIAEQTIDTSPRWEHWLSVFLDTDHFDEISLRLPSSRLKPPISSTYYEAILLHYVFTDPVHLQKLLDKWAANLFSVPAVVKALETRLDDLDSKLHKKDDESLLASRRVLRDCLASLHLADGRPADALRCYLRTQNAEPVIQLVRDFQLFHTIADDVFTFMTIRLSDSQMETAPIKTLDSLSAEPIDLLTTATAQNLIEVSDVVNQLRSRSPASDPYLFFYFRGLWNGESDKLDTDDNGDTIPKQAPQLQARRSRFAPLPPTNTTRGLLSPYANLTVSLFAEYSPPLLSALIRASDATIDADTTGGSLPYTFEHASDVCKSHGLTSELVYLLAAIGQTRQALHLIIDGIGDVHRAIAFAREVDDKGLWEDLLQYSLDKPPFIRGLLEDVGAGMGDDDDVSDGGTTAIDPITLVSRIPDGLAIEGLKDALSRIVADSEVQCSIAQGAARVLQGEVALLIDQITQGRARGVAFDFNDNASEPAVASSATSPEVRAENGIDPPSDATEVRPSQEPASRTRRCAICDEPSMPLANVIIGDFNTQDYLLGYPCGHVYHLGCLLDAVSTSSNKSVIDDLQRKMARSLSLGVEQDGWQRGRTGAKMARASMISAVIGDRPCLVCERRTKNNEIKE